MFFNLLAFSNLSLDINPANTNTVSTVKIENAAYDALMIRENISKPVSAEYPKQWTYDIVMFARFKENLIAGNTDALLSQTSGLRIKRRKVGEFKWITIYENSALTGDVSDFTFEIFDRYARSNVEYEYGIAIICNGIESATSIARARSAFDGLCVMDREQIFHTLLETEVTVQQNQGSVYVAPLSSKYPFVVHNGRTNYASGTATGLFALPDHSTGEYPVNFEDTHMHRRNLMDFLCNGSTKLLKYFDGRMWLVDIIENPSENAMDHKNMILTSFEWAEVGDCEDKHDLYGFGLIDAKPIS